MSFIMHRNVKYNTELLDAALTGAMRLRCPKCGRENNFIMFQYEELNGSVGRRYYYICPYCKVHYTDWGPGYDYKGSHRIVKRCQNPAKHREDRRRFIRMLMVS
jgi:phage FluMu protein Com